MSLLRSTSINIWCRFTCNDDCKGIRPVFLLLAAYLLVSPARGEYGGGSGIEQDPYLIYGPNQMQAIGADANDWDKHFKLMADIDLSCFTGNSLNIIGNIREPFKGVFDGNGKKISNFTHNSATRGGYIGLFGVVCNAEIKDLGLISPNVGSGAGDYVGSLVGMLTDAVVTGCYAQGGSVSGDDCVGGLIGSNAGTVTTCYAAVSVSGHSKVGGLVGANWSSSRYGDGTIFNSYSVGRVLGNSEIGGLVGHSSGRVEDSFWDVEASGQTTSARGTGKTTAQMQDPNTLMEVGWDFVGESDGPSDIWAEPVGGGYPILWWQLSVLPALPNFSGGSGTEYHPYLISTISHLNGIGHNPRLMECCFMLIGGIDLRGVDFFIIGDSMYPFSGTFDGNGKTISNFTYKFRGLNNTGLFGVVVGEVKGLCLRDPSIEVGNGRNTGSLIGQIGAKGSVSDCYVEGGTVSGDTHVGGLAGQSSGTVTKCYSSAKVSGDWAIGGLVGRNHGSISKCYATGNVSVPRGYPNVGGLVGYNCGRGKVTDCYATGSVSGDLCVGGLVGNSDFGTVTNCYSTGSISGDRKAGGLLGWNGEGSTVASSFWNIETSGQKTSAAGTGKTTAEMHMKSTFTSVGWDFTTPVWTIRERRNYPRLAWQIPR